METTICVSESKTVQVVITDSPHLERTRDGSGDVRVTYVRCTWRRTADGDFTEVALRGRRVLKSGADGTMPVDLWWIRDTPGWVLELLEPHAPSWWRAAVSS